MPIKTGMLLEQIVIKTDEDLPTLLREAANYIENNNLSLWDLFIDAEPDENGQYFARLILEGFVKNAHPDR